MATGRSYQTIANLAADRLSSAGHAGTTARGEAALLARWLLGWDVATWLTRSLDEAPATFSDAYLVLVERRAQREPVAYITGEREFYGRRFQVTRDVLIPRPETELIIERLLALAPELPPSCRVTDLGTGSGCLAITAALELPQLQVDATDVSTAALEVARRNATALGARVTFQHRALTGTAGRGATVILTNPPYVPDGDRATLPADVRDYEPAGALFAGADGLAVIRQVVATAPSSLAPGGWLLMEIGAGQADEVRTLIAAEPDLRLVSIHPDLQGIPRVVELRRIQR